MPSILTSILSSNVSIDRDLVKEIVSFTQTLGISEQNLIKQSVIEQVKTELIKDIIRCQIVSTAIKAPLFTMLTDDIKYSRSYYVQFVKWFNDELICNCPDVSSIRGFSTTQYYFTIFNKVKNSMSHIMQSDETSAKINNIYDYINELFQLRLQNQVIPKQTQNNNSLVTIPNPLSVSRKRKSISQKPSSTTQKSNTNLRSNSYNHQTKKKSQQSNDDKTSSSLLSAYSSSLSSRSQSSAFHQIQSYHKSNHIKFSQDLSTPRINHIKPSSALQLELRSELIKYYIPINKSCTSDDLSESDIRDALESSSYTALLLIQIKELIMSFSDNTIYNKKSTTKCNTDTFDNDIMIQIGYTSNTRGLKHLHLPHNFRNDLSVYDYYNDYNMELNEQHHKLFRLGGDLIDAYLPQSFIDLIPQSGTHCVQITKMSPSSKVNCHREKNDISMQLVVTFGDYTGGETRLFNEEESHYIDVNTNENPTLCDARLSHTVLNVKSGMRYCFIVYFMFSPTETKSLPIFDYVSSFSHRSKKVIEKSNEQKFIESAALFYFNPNDISDVTTAVNIIHPTSNKEFNSHELSKDLHKKKIQCHIENKEYISNFISLLLEMFPEPAARHNHLRQILIAATFVLHGHSKNARPVLPGITGLSKKKNGLRLFLNTFNDYQNASEWFSNLPKSKSCYKVIPYTSKFSINVTKRSKSKSSEYLKSLNNLIAALYSPDTDKQLKISLHWCYQCFAKCKGVPVLKSSLFIPYILTILWKINLFTEDDYTCDTLSTFMYKVNHKNSCTMKLLKNYCNKHDSDDVTTYIRTFACKNNIRPISYDDYLCIMSSKFESLFPSLN